MWSKFALITILLFLFSCSGNESEEESKEIKWTKDNSTQLNKDLAVEEELRIRMYLLDRKTWKTKKTGSGLRYYIYQEGSGKKAEAGMTAEVKYKISLLDGTLCYQTDSLTSESFRIDRSEVETGVQEGIKKMKIGDKAKLIIPSHLAHGLTGDLDKIPPLNTLIIDIELISLKNE